jgi:hypothetical protein
LPTLDRQEKEKLQEDDAQREAMEREKREKEREKAREKREKDERGNMAKTQEKDGKIAKAEYASNVNGPLIILSEVNRDPKLKFKL